ncbi:MAG: hypothetical protein IT379_12045, partial [Deltaproteobacteria bacterium]|nr:hypothetical protein [Deltaproteobacteria bacterium]
MVGLACFGLVFGLGGKWAIAAARGALPELVRDEGDPSQRLFSRGEPPFAATLAAATPLHRDVALQLIREVHASRAVHDAETVATLLALARLTDDCETEVNVLLNHHRLATAARRGETCEGTRARAADAWLVAARWRDANRVLSGLPVARTDAYRLAGGVVAALAASPVTPAAGDRVAVTRARALASRARALATGTPMASARTDLGQRAATLECVADGLAARAEPSGPAVSSLRRALGEPERWACRLMLAESTPSPVERAELLRSVVGPELPVGRAIGRALRLEAEMEAAPRDASAPVDAAAIETLHEDAKLVLAESPILWLRSMARHPEAVVAIHERTLARLARAQSPSAHDRLVRASLAAELALHEALMGRDEAAARWLTTMRADEQSLGSSVRPEQADRLAVVAPLVALLAGRFGETRAQLSRLRSTRLIRAHAELHALLVAAEGGELRELRGKIDRWSPLEERAWAVWEAGARGRADRVAYWMHTHHLDDTSRLLLRLLAPRMRARPAPLVAWLEHGIREVGVSFRPRAAAQEAAWLAVIARALGASSFARAEGARRDRLDALARRRDLAVPLALIDAGW